MVIENVRLDAELLKKLGVFSLVSGEVAAAVGGGHWLGRVIDQRFVPEKTVFAILLPLLGLIYCVWRIQKAAKQWWG